MNVQQGTASGIEALGTIDPIETYISIFFWRQQELKESQSPSVRPSVCLFVRLVQTCLEPSISSSIWLKSSSNQSEISQQSVSNQWALRAHSESTQKELIQAVPKKTGILGKMPITGLWRGLEIKIGWVLKNSGNFLSNEHKNFVFLYRNDWEIKAQS